MEFSKEAVTGWSIGISISITAVSGGSDGGIMISSISSGSGTGILAMSSGGSTGGSTGGSMGGSIGGSTGGSIGGSTGGSGRINGSPKKRAEKVQLRPEISTPHPGTQ